MKSEHGSTNQHASQAKDLPVTHRLRVTGSLWERLRAHHLAQGKHTEAISLALGHVHHNFDGTLTIVLSSHDGLMLFADDCYERRSFGAAVLRREVRAQVMWRAVQEGWTAVVDIHDHHFAQRAAFSSVDDRDDRATASYFAETLPAHTQRPPVAAALLLAQQDAVARFVGGDPSIGWGAPMRVDVVGSHGLNAPGLASPETQEASRVSLHARHACILPPAAQWRLAGLRVAVAGCGGTGSIAAEALARLGIGHLSLIDSDRIEMHNLNRLQGCGVADVGRYKTEVLAERLFALMPDVRVDAVCCTVHEGIGREHLAAADVVIGCVDNAETRWWLNRAAVQHLQPYFDAGVLVEAAKDPRFVHRINIIIPGAGPCGECSPIDYFPRQRPAAFLDGQTLRVQREAGYLEGVASTDGGGDPSLYGLNLQAVGTLMQEFTTWAAGRPVAHSVAQVAAEGLSQRLRLQDFGGAPASDCPLCSTLLGAAESAPLPVANESGIDGICQEAGSSVQAALRATFGELADD